MTQKASPADFYLHTPAETSANFIAWAERIQNQPGITFGCILDKYVIPPRPGDFVSIVSRPGHGKTSFMSYMAKRESLAILERRTHDRECVVYVSGEQPTEELEAYFQSDNRYTVSDVAWGRVDIDIVKARSIKRIGIPLWFIGTSVMDSHLEKPPMTIEVVYDCIRSLRSEFNLQPTLICLDYIQKFNVRGLRERTAQVTEATFEAKNLFMDLGCPGLVGVQASRDVDKRNIAGQIPTMADCQWASAVEQTEDKQLSLWRPNQTYHSSELVSVTVGGHEYDNVPELLVIGLRKQRMEKGFGTWAVHFDPSTLELSGYYVDPLPKNLMML